MRVGIRLPTRRARRLEAGMAADGSRPSSERLLTRARAWDAERIASALAPRRDHLVEQLPRELAAARGLSRDQCELVIDEAIDYMVTEYAKPITDRHALERAFWATASFRVKRIHEGRGATVRAGWQRVDIEDVEIAAVDPDPAASSGRPRRRTRRAAGVRRDPDGARAPRARV
jgi:hypothetical protein